MNRNIGISIDEEILENGNLIIIATYCPNCGSSIIEHEGKEYYLYGIKDSYRCMECDSLFGLQTPELIDEEEDKIIKRIYKNKSNGQLLVSIPKDSDLKEGDYVKMKRVD